MRVLPDRPLERTATGSYSSSSPPSAGSGLRTYRGPEGVWEDHDVERLGHVEEILPQRLGVDA